MKRISILLLLLGVYTIPLFSMPANDYIVPLCRSLNKDLFGPNASSLFSPTMSVVNAATNTSFFHSAYVPAKVKRPYFRFTLSSFGGIVSDNMKTFNPLFPRKAFQMGDLTQFGDITILPEFVYNIKDTAGLMRYILLTSIDSAIRDGSLQLPSTSATMLGDSGAAFRVDMSSLLPKNPLYPLLKAVYPDLLEMLEENLNFNLGFKLPDGGNFNSIIAGVPQLEVGSLFGTELLVRLIPPIDFGEYIGSFSFWGIGLKHSISQYFFEDKNEYGNTYNRENAAPIDVAVQVVYQHTNLNHTVGYTQSKLNVVGDIYNINVNISKNLFNWIEIYSGLSYEKINTKGTYNYILPYEVQTQIGLMRYTPENNSGVVEPPEFPGDNQPQIENIVLTHDQMKWTIGIAATLGPVIIFADYSVTKFPVWGAGLQIKF